MFKDDAQDQLPEVGFAYRLYATTPRAFFTPLLVAQSVTNRADSRAWRTLRNW